MGKWKSLTASEKSRVIKFAMQNGISDINTIRDAYNMYADGGNINIKPENRGKFTELKERTGKSSTWYKEHGTPEQKKMAIFALNARKWNHKHEDGGNTNVPIYTSSFGNIPVITPFDATASQKAYPEEWKDMGRLAYDVARFLPITRRGTDFIDMFGYSPSYDSPLSDGKYDPLNLTDVANAMGYSIVNPITNTIEQIGNDNVSLQDIYIKQSSPMKWINKIDRVGDMLQLINDIYNISKKYKNNHQENNQNTHKHDGTESDSKLHIIKDRLLRNINPATSYDNPYGRLFNALILNKSDYSDDRDPIADAAFAKYLGYKYDKDVIKKSKYAPTKAKDKVKKDYYTFDGLIINNSKDKFAEENTIDFLNAVRALPFNGTALGNYPPVLNDFTYSRGFDNKGEYVSVYDKYDINPFGKNKYGDKSFGLGEPFEFYDRLYLDDYYGIPEKYRGTTYLPEIIVTPKAQGGYLQNQPSKPFSYKPIPSVRYDFGGFIRNLFGLNDAENNKSNNKTDLIDMGELANRQAYTESGFVSDKVSPAGARGMFQIVPAVLEDYNKAKGTSYTKEQLRNDTINTDVRNWYFGENLMNRSWVNKEDQNDSVRVAKALAAYNYGPGNTLKVLNKAKEKGIDIYNGWDWVNFFPKETQDYINFILRGQNNSLHRNDSVYKITKSKESNKDKVSLISEKTK